MKKTVLQKLQQTELEILTVIDSFCKKYDIVYSLYAGTAIGAVRHKGFIPWDDDIDIAMTRSEYNKFCTQWEKGPVKGYYLQNLVTDPKCSICHAKVQKEGTMFIGEGEDTSESQNHYGIWVDIFPFDKDTKKNHRILLKTSKKLVMLSRANVIYNNEGIIKKIIKRFTRIIYPDEKRRMEILKCVHRLDDMDKSIKGQFVWKELSAMYMFKYSYPKHITENTIPIQFEGKSFPIYSGYDEMLRIFYGDYMKLPPEEERICKHKPEKIIFDIEDRQ